MKFKIEIDMDVLGDSAEGRDKLLQVLREATADVTRATKGGLWPGIGEKLFEPGGRFCGTWSMGT